MKSFVSADSRRAGRLPTDAGRLSRVHTHALWLRRCRHYARFIEEQSAQRDAFIGALPLAGARGVCLFVYLFVCLRCAPAGLVRSDVGQLLVWNRRSPFPLV
jgi:hypothetical protein